MDQTESALLRIIRITLAVTLALFPLVFLTVTPNFYDTPKLIYLGVIFIVILLLWSVKTATSKVVLFSLYPRVLAFVALFLAAAISTLISSPNKVEALVQPAGAVVFFILSFLIFSGSLISDRMFTGILRWSLIISASILSLITIYMYFGIGSMMFPDVKFLADKFWTPVGSGVALLTLLLTVLPLAVQQAYSGFRDKNDSRITVGSVAVILIGFAAILTTMGILPVISTAVLPLGASWAIVLEMFKAPRYAFFGVGPENFLGAFTAARPAIFNAGPLWNTRFIISGSAFLHLSTTLGMFGVVASLLLLRTLGSGVRTTGHLGLKISLVVLILAFLFTPYSLTIIVITGAVLLLVSETEQVTTASFRIPDHIGYVAYLVSFLGIATAATFLYFGGRLVLSETIFFRSLKAAEANRGNDTYNLQIQAIQTNPYNTNFRIAYSQTNLALANSIATSIQATASGEQVQLSEDTRQTISQLIQQAIREAKIATQISPVNIFAWETLARTYSSILNIVQGSDDWAIASYQQAVQLDPTNPSHRLNLAGLYINRNDLDSAVTQLQAAQFLKPDAAVTYYNLAYVYGIRKEYDKQVAFLEQALKLLPEGSEDATRVNQELAEAKKMTGTASTNTQNTQPPQGTTEQSPLSPPQTTPEAVITPKIELPEESSPSVQPIEEPTRL